MSERRWSISAFDALVFTGGIETGMDIVRNAGIKPMILELSGNDAGIVCSDADVETAARGGVLPERSGGPARSA